MHAACESAPMIYPRPVSDGQFYSPPESVAGDDLNIFAIHLLLYARLFPDFCKQSLFFFFTDPLSADSDEDLDEEGLGRKAVTFQVPVSVPVSCFNLMFFIISLVSPYLDLTAGEGVRQTGSRGNVCGGADPHPGGKLEI